MSEPLGIALVGCGTVGGGVAKLLLEQPDRLAARAGRPLALRRVVVRDPDKPRAVAIPRELDHHRPRSRARTTRRSTSSSSWSAASTGRPAGRCSTLLAAGKHVVTANKALLAEHGAEVFDAARRHGRAVAFEASVAGGVPIIARPGRRAWPPTRSLSHPGHPQRHLQLHPHRR